MAAQLMGALCGAGCIYANYFHAIDIFEGGRGIRTVPGTAGLFSTYAVSRRILRFSWRFDKKLANDITCERLVGLYDFRLI
jgi:hypothetical protein